MGRMWKGGEVGVSVGGLIDGEKDEYTGEKERNRYTVERGIIRRKIIKEQWVRRDKEKLDQTIYVNIWIIIDKTDNKDVD